MKLLGLAAVGLAGVLALGALGGGDGGGLPSPERLAANGAGAYALGAGGKACLSKGVRACFGGSGGGGGGGGASGGSSKGSRNESTSTTAGPPPTAPPTTQPPSSPLSPLGRPQELRSVGPIRDPGRLVPPHPEGQFGQLEPAPMPGLVFAS